MENQSKEVVFRVSLSPQFRAMAEHWSAEKCLRMAKHFGRLAHQLQLRGDIAIADAAHKLPRGSLVAIASHLQKLN